MTTDAAPLRVIIADDEPLARRRLRDLLEEAGGVSIVAECSNGASVLDAVGATHPDMVLLDVEMPARDGIGVAELLRPHGDDGPVFVFVTAHPMRGVPAFGVPAADYLLKPCSGKRLAAALDRARELLRARPATRGSPP